LQRQRQSREDPNALHDRKKEQAHQKDRNSSGRRPNSTNKTSEKNKRTKAGRQAGNEAMNNTSDDRHTGSERDTKNKTAADTQPQAAAAGAEEQTLALARETKTQETLAMAKEEREREKEKRDKKERETKRWVKQKVIINGDK
jgi:hypothetical protein